MSARVCERCGEQNRTDATFCVACGARIGGGTCQCGIKHPPGTAFCPNCGNPIEGAAAPEMGRRAQRRTDAGTRWVRGEHEIAARITPADLKGRLTSGLEVQHGTRALLFLGGRYVGTLPPGRHTLETTWQKLKLPSDGEPVAVVVDDGELDLELHVEDLHAKDNFRVDANARAAVRMVEPEIFLANLFRDRAIFSLDDLIEYVSPEVRATLREAVAAHTARELSDGIVRANLEQTLLSRWKPTLDRIGFVLSRFRVLEMTAPDLAAGEKIVADTAADDARRDALRGQQRQRIRGDHDDRALDIEAELAAMQQEVDHLARRQPLFEELLQEENVARMAGLRSEEEWRQFQRQIDRDRLLSDAEWEELRKETAAKAAHAELQRHYAFERLNAQASAELQQLIATQDYQLQLLKVRGETEVAQAEIKKARVAFDDGLERQRLEFEQRREQQRAQEEQRLGLLAQARQGQIESLKAMAELHQWEQDRNTEREQMIEDRKHARDLAKAVQCARDERDKIKADAEANRLLLDALKGLNTDQIIGYAALKGQIAGADVARALEALQSGQVSARERELLERIVSEIKEANKAKDDLVRDLLPQPAAAWSPPPQPRATPARPEPPTERRWCETDRRWFTGDTCPLCGEPRRSPSDN